MIQRWLSAVRRGSGGLASTISFSPMPGAQLLLSIPIAERGRTISDEPGPLPKESAGFWKPKRCWLNNETVLW